MTPVEAVTVGVPLLGALAQATVALSKVWRIHERLRELEQARPAQGGRIGDVEKAADILRGRVEELSRSVNKGVR